MKILSTRALEKQERNETLAMINELELCEESPIYFIENYLKIETPFGQIPFILSAPQRRLVESLANYSNVISLQPRQAGQTSAVISFLAWKTIFSHSEKTLFVAPNQNLASMALDFAKELIISAPAWLRSDISRISFESIELCNGSEFKVLAAPAQAGHKLRTTNLVFSDFAINSDICQRKIWSSLLPVAGKIFVGSTPVRRNDLFHSLWLDSQIGNNSFAPVRVTWQEIFSPLKYIQLVSKMGAATVRREYDCEFD